MQYITSKTKGKGGGKADIAQGGGGDLEKLDSVLQSIVDWIKEKIFSS